MLSAWHRCLWDNLGHMSHQHVHTLVIQVRSSNACCSCPTELFLFFAARLTRTPRKRHHQLMLLAKHQNVVWQHPLSQALHLFTYLEIQRYW